MAGACRAGAQLLEGHHLRNRCRLGAHAHPCVENLRAAGRARAGRAATHPCRVAAAAQIDLIHVPAPADRRRRSENTQAISQRCPAVVHMQRVTCVLTAAGLQAPHRPSRAAARALLPRGTCSPTNLSLSLVFSRHRSLRSSTSRSVNHNQSITLVTPSKSRRGEGWL